MSKRSLRSLVSLLFFLPSLLFGIIAWSPAASATGAGIPQLKNGVPVAVKVTAHGARFTFPAVTNQHFTLAITKPVTRPAGSCLQMIVTDASNNQDAQTEFSTTPADINLTPTSAEAGKTTVTIEPDSSFCTPATSATLTLVWATDVTGALTSGKTVSTDLKFEGQNADYTFAGVINHHVTVAVTNPLTSPGGSCLQVAAYNTSNAQYASSEFSTSPTDINFAPSQSGTVTVVVSPDSSFCTAASSATLSLTYAKDVGGPLKSGVPNNVDLKYEGQNAVFTFTAVAHRSVRLAVTKPVTSPAGSCLQMVVTDPSNNQDAQTEFSTSPAKITFTPTAAEAGLTTVTIEPDSSFCTPASTGTLTLTYTAG
jgi:hypothetical protein